MHRFHSMGNINNLRASRIESGSMNLRVGNNLNIALPIVPCTARTKVHSPISGRIGRREVTVVRPKGNTVLVGAGHLLSSSFQHSPPTRQCAPVLASRADTAKSTTMPERRDPLKDMLSWLPSPIVIVSVRSGGAPHRNCSTGKRGVTGPRAVTFAVEFGLPGDAVG